MLNDNDLGIPFGRLSFGYTGGDQSHVLLIMLIHESDLLLPKGFLDLGSLFT